MHDRYLSDVEHDSNEKTIGNPDDSAAQETPRSAKIPRIDSYDDPEQEEMDEFFTIPDGEDTESDYVANHRMLITIIAVAVVALVLFVAVYFVAMSKQIGPSTSVSKREIVRSGDLEGGVAFESDYATSIPNLVACFGKTRSEVEALIGSEYVLSGTESAGTTTDSKNSVTYTYSTGSSSVPFSNPPKITFEFDSQGLVVYADFESSFELVGLEDCTFDDLVADKSVLVQVLGDCGVTQGVSSYSVPDKASCTTYADPDAAIRVISEQSAEFDGQTGLTQKPLEWDVVWTYEYPDSPDDAEGSLQTPTRTLEVTLQ